MKKIENSFVLTGFVGNNAEIRQFQRFSSTFLIGSQPSGEEWWETNRVSAFMNMEAWRKNEHVDSFDKLQKGTMLTVEGYFKPDKWVDQQGTKAQPHRLHRKQVLSYTRQGGTPAAEPEKPTKKAKK